MTAHYVRPDDGDSHTESQVSLCRASKKNHTELLVLPVIGGAGRAVHA